MAFGFPLDYRSTNSEYKFKHDIPPYKSCLYFDFNDKGRHPFITPRMAYRIFESGASMKERLERTQKDDWVAEGFPECCRFYLKISWWKHSFIAALERVLLRLEHGMDFQCNCTAEEMAVHKILDEIEATAGTYEHRGIQQYPDYDPSERYESLYMYHRLPNYGARDRNWKMIRKQGLKDQRVTMLYNPKISALAVDHKSHLSERMNCIHLHPSTWFLAFTNDEFGVDFIQKPLNEATIWVFTCGREKLALDWLRQSFWKQDVFLIQIWSNIGGSVPSLGSILQERPSLISMALNRRRPQPNYMYTALTHLSKTIKHIKCLNEEGVLSTIRLVLVIFYRLKKECIQYLQHICALFAWICNDYYLLGLGLEDGMTTTKQSILMQFYCILLSIMAKKLYHNTHQVENEQYLIGVLDNIDFECLVAKSISSNGRIYQQSMDMFHAIITFAVNTKVSRANYKYLKCFNAKFMDQMKCFNAKCLKRSTVDNKLKLCSHCMVARYCCKKCQKKHWNIHKVFCSVF
eukprot:911127_1